MPHAPHSQCRLPAAPGVGFKPEHFDAIAGTTQPIRFLEIHAENYMGAGGPPHARLTRLRQDYALSVHGVGLSIGSTKPLDKAHLARLRILCDRYEADSFSEHLAWSSHEGNYMNDLLPLPYTEETLEQVVAHVAQTQDALGRQMLLENPATYLIFEESRIDETEFLDAVARRTGCGLLLDINNVFVSATNHQTGAMDYLARFPLAHVGEIHVAGHAETVDGEGGPLLVDTHDRPVKEAVWDLLDTVISRTGPLPCLVEWDNDVPDWSVLRGEAERVSTILARHAGAKRT